MQEKKACIFCGNEFTKKETCSLLDWFGGENARRKNGVQYCSKKCCDKDKIGKKSKSTTIFKKGQRPWNKGLNGYKAGCLNNKWRGGITTQNEKFRKSKAYIVWRKIILLRDNFTCQDCGVSGVKLHAHHIQYFSKFPEKRLIIENGITLCIDCHKKIHKNLKITVSC